MRRRDELADRHTPWCARDHRCALAEHRSAELVIDAPGRARAVLTRVGASDGRDHAEIRVRLALAPDEPHARRQLALALAGLRTLLGRAA